MGNILPSNRAALHATITWHNPPSPLRNGPARSPSSHAAHWCRRGPTVFPISEIPSAYSIPGHSMGTNDNLFHLSATFPQSTFIRFYHPQLLSILHTTRTLSFRRCMWLGPLEEIDTKHWEGVNIMFLSYQVFSGLSWLCYSHVPLAWFCMSLPS